MLFNVDVEEETSSSRSFFSFASKTFFSSDVFWYLIQTSRNFRLIKKDGEREREKKKETAKLFSTKSCPKWRPKSPKKLPKECSEYQRKEKLFLFTAPLAKSFSHLSSFLDANLDTDPYFCLFFCRGCNFNSRMRARVDPFSLRKKAPNHLVAKLQRSRKWRYSHSGAAMQGAPGKKCKFATRGEKRKL